MKYLLWCVFIAMLAVSSTLGETETTKHETLGKGYYLPDRNIIDDSFIGGSSFFQDSSLPTECFAKTKPGSAGKTSSDMAYYKDTKSFYEQFGASLGLSATLSSSFMLDGALKYVSSKESKSSVTGMSLTVKSTKSVEVLSKNCINEKQLSQSLLEGFDRLPANISNPKLPSSWASYKNFLKKYGSHMATEIVYGSQLIQWEFSETSSKLSKRELAAKACADLYAGVPTSGAPEAKACANFSREELSSAEKVDTQEKVTVAGGSPDTQAKLRTAKSRTDELIMQLIKEGKGDFAGPIGYKWKALYDILLQRFFDGDRNLKARNLRVYFVGLKNYGCEPQKERDTVLREFVRLTPGNEYVCRVPGQGCRAHSDCHVKFGKLGCYCHGNTCIDKVKVGAGGEEKEERVIRKQRSQKYNVGVNKSCKAGFFKECKCVPGRLEPEWVIVWSSESGTKKVSQRSALTKPKTEKKQQEDGLPKTEKKQQEDGLEEEGSAISP